MRAAVDGGQYWNQGNRRARRAHARRIASRPHLVGAALVAAGAVVLSSVAAVEPALPLRAEARAQLDVHGDDIRLAAASSVLNIPQNLLVDIVNMPYNALKAFDVMASAQLWGGHWLVTGPSNIWGTDPADAARFTAAAAMLVPIPALSGFNTEISAANPLGVLGGDGIGQQFWRFMAAELPVSPYCDASVCVPTTPMSPITGIRGIDSLVWNAMMFTGLVDFPMLSGWFKVPSAKLANGTFDAATTYIEDPSGEVYTLDGFGIPGTVKGPNGENLLPWAGTPINLNIAKPFENWRNHLMGDPSGNSIKLPNLVQFARSLQTMAAGIVVGFDPFTPGSSLCPGYCEGLSPDLDYPAIVKWIGSLWPGNEKIDTWLAAYKAGTANTPTGIYIERNIELLKNGAKFWDFSNPPLDPMFLNIDTNPGDFAPAFHKFWTSLGLKPDPLYPAKPTAAEAPVQVPQPGAATLESAPTTATEVGGRHRAESAVEDAPAAVGDGVEDAPTAVDSRVEDAPTAADNRVEDAPISGVDVKNVETTTSGPAAAGHRARGSESKNAAGSPRTTVRGGNAHNTPDKEGAEGR